jgi:hypothetical protein
MMLSRLACILICVYAPQVAAAQLAAAARYERRRPPRRGAPAARPALVRVSLVAAGAGLVATTAVTGTGVRIDAVCGVGYRIVAS